MNYEKISSKSKSDIKKDLEHVCRGQKDIPSHNHSNEKIDKTKTKYNYDLKERHGLSAKEYFDNRIKYIEELTLERTGKSIRKDAVKLCSWILTVPKDLPEQKQAEFFKYGYEFLCKRYHGNGENVITASVHLDETTPHMHFQFIPIVMDKKGGFEKLCAKNLETKTSLAKVHQEMKSYLEKKLQCEVNILNGATENGNKSILELKNESLKSKNEQLSKENAMMENHLKELNEKLQEQRAEQEKNINNLISAIPPLILEEYPPKPQPPQKPEYKSYYIDKKEEREDKKAWKIYEKEMSIYERKTIPQWEKECAKIKARNDILQLEWDNKYKTMDNLRKAQKQISNELLNVNYLKQQAKSNNNRALEELHKAEEERKKIENEQKQQAEIFQREVQQGIQREIKRRFKGLSTEMAERLENFCNSIKFKDGSSVLERFEKMEEKLKQDLEIE